MIHLLSSRTTTKRIWRKVGWYGFSNHPDGDIQESHPHQRRLRHTGLLLAFGKYREAPGLTGPEKTRLMQLAATPPWLAAGGAMEDGVWMKDGEACSYDQKDTLSFIESHYKGHQVSLVNVVYGRDAWGCCGLFSDILGSPAIGKEIRDWVSLNGVWYQIDYFVSDKMDVQIKKIPVVKINLQNEGDEKDKV